MIMSVLGMAISYGGLFVVPGTGSAGPGQVETAAAPAETEAAEKETPSPAAAAGTAQLRETSPSEAEVPETEESKEKAPGPERFNLVYRFPEGADASDPMESYGGKAFRDLYERDNSWSENVFGASSRKPLAVAGSLGIPRDSLMGKYNITDKNHDPEDPSTWVIGKWTKIDLVIKDGNGVPTPQSSNVKEILAMASVYTWYHDPEDAEAFREYARALWSASHSSSISVGDVYYDTDCLTQEQIDKAVAKGRVWPAASGSDANRASGSDADRSVSEAPEGADADTASADSGASSEPSEGAAGPGTSYGPGAASMPRETESAAAEAESAAAGESSAAEEETAAPEEGAGPESQNAECPGHVDLKINAVIWTMDGKKNLFTLDKRGNSKNNFNDSWQGWTEERISEAKALAAADWYQDYGLSVSLLSGTEPLTDTEVEEQLSMLPEDLPETRKALAETALRSIGRIPYYYGGKAVSADYEKNGFYNVVLPDYKGRIFRGLDCSGWLAWVYWNATGKQLSESSTAGQIHLGRGIKRSELKTGDIIIRAGNDETMGHVLMFLRWSEDGEALCIHETGGVTNNVCFKLNEDVGASCRNLVD